uniref:Uncharacterized protein n=1 Tax=Tanacetum cinerariifolium TaxID=118510 RepID=A0A699J4C6_TANCI|nr:hypothetical protein [Tanacetum cinerariifolium]
MAFPPRDQTHQYLRYEGLQYIDANIADFKMRLARIYKREVHRVQVYDFEGLPNLMAEGLSGSMLMEHRDAQGQSVFTSRAWRYLRLFALGRNQGATISGVRELMVIDMFKLVILHIYEEIDDTWALVASKLERHPDAVAGSPGAAEDAPIVDEGDQAISAPVQAPQPPPVARTMP